MEIVFGIILLIASVFLIVAVLLQGGKSNTRLSGAIAGGAETFFGKSKASTMEKKLSRLTIIVAIVFSVLVIAMYLIQDTTNYSDAIKNAAGQNVEEVIDTPEVELADEAAETAAQ